MPAPALPTLSDALTRGTRLLEPASDSPRLDAELLLCAATGLSRTALFTDPGRALDARENAAFESLVERRQQGEPVAYLLGERDFWTLTLKVGPAVLVPRPETELVVERSLRHLDGDRPRRVLDLATGSGAIALALASERPQDRLVATDLSDRALALARDNAMRLGIANVAFRQGSWYDPVAADRFDVIASNPPYIAAGDPELADDVLAWEPEAALIAGPRGLECIEAIVSGARPHLEPGGWLVLEHGARQGDAVRRLLEAAGFARVTSHADLAGHERVTEGCRP